MKLLHRVQGNTLTGSGSVLSSVKNPLVFETSWENLYNTDP